MSSPDNTPSSPFGRGWIPADRALGLPDDGNPPHAWGGGSGLAADGGGFRAGAALWGRAPSTAVPAVPLPTSGEDLPSSSASPCSSESCPEGKFTLSEAEGCDPPASAAHQGEPRHNAFTPQRQARFLHHLAVSGSVRAACARVALSPQAAYVCRRRCARFAAGWDAALVLARAHAEAVLAERALEGVEEAVFYHGEEIARRRRYDSRLLLAHLARLDRAAERDPLAAARAARFDELLAMLAGEEPAGLAPVPDWTPAGARAPDPFLPVPRADHVRAETEGLGPRAYPRARKRAEAAWDRWREQAEAAVDRLDAGEGGGEGPERGPETGPGRVCPANTSRSKGRRRIFRHNRVNFVNLAAAMDSAGAP